MEKHYRTCHLCEAMCGLEITTNQGLIESIKGDKNDVHSKGYLCPKAVALQDIHEDPNRLKYPVKRTEDGWQQISWEEAFDLVEENIKHIRKKHGGNAVGVYTGNPTTHNTGTILYLYDFINSIGTKNSYASHSLDQLPQMFVAGEMFGHQAMFPVPDIAHTDFFLILGANPLVSNGSIMSTPNIGAKFKELQQRGGKIVVIDPRRTRTAQAADTHHFIKPGTDVFLLLAFVRELLANNLVKDSHVLEITDNITELQALVEGYTPEVVSDIVGIAPEAIKQLVSDFAQAPKAIIYGRMGVSTVKFGGVCHWLINAINILTGNLDVPGGVMFTLPAIDLLKALKKEAKQLRWRSRVKQLPETGGALPTVTMADEMLTPGEDQIKAMITVAGNPLLSAPNSNELKKGFEQLDFYVAIDIYINETTRHANVILPPAAALEVIHYDFALSIVSPRNIANFSPAIFPIAKDRKYDWEILIELQKRIEQGNVLALKLKHTLLNWLTAERRIDLGLKIGPYGVWGGRLFKKGGISLKRLKKAPHGVDFGPMQSSLPKRLFTKNKRIDLAPQEITKELSKVYEALQAKIAQQGELLLIGRRHLRSNNSWMHNYPRLMKDGDKRCTAMLHSEEAQKRDIADGDWMEVSTTVGQIKIRAEITDEVMPGVLCIPHGWGHSDKQVHLDVASKYAGVNVNELIDHSIYEEMSGNAVFSGIPVKVKVFAETAS
ncbi:MAG TPA: dehydrogenase [Microscillaceae bacterium]|nr:dehydrogenase [Microscillaceae bacterium]